MVQGVNLTKSEWATYFELSGKVACIDAQLKSRAAFESKYGLSKDDEKMAIKQAEAIIECVSSETIA